MSTFVNEDPQAKEIPQVQQVENQNKTLGEIAENDGTKKPREETPFDAYFKSLNARYVERCKEMSQQKEFHIAIRQSDGTDKIKRFTRKHLTQGQLEEIEDQRALAEELTKTQRGSKEQRNANLKWYTMIGSKCLYDPIAKEFLSEEDFTNAVNKDIKPILDGCIMAEMAGVPN